MNAGPDAAVSAVEMVQVPAHTSFVSFSAPAGATVNAPAPGTEGPATVMVTVPSAPPNQSESLNLVVQVDPGAAVGTVITSTASVSSLTIDPNPGNNSASVSSTVTAASPTATSPVTVTAFQVAKVKSGHGKHSKSALALAVSFDGPLDPAAAQNLAAYSVFSGKVKKLHKVSQVVYNSLVPLSGAMYVPGSEFVVLFPRGVHKLPKLEQLHVNVSILTDPMDREINNGKNFTATVTNTGLVVSADRYTGSEPPAAVAIDALYEQETGFLVRGVRRGP
jgi:hypothetical protein